MRRGFLISEWLVVLVVLSMLGGMAPLLDQHVDRLRWRNVERQIRLLRHRGLNMNKRQTNELRLSGDGFALNDEAQIKLPPGWFVVNRTHIKLSYRKPQSGTVYLTNGTQDKRLVFQVGGGTFDIQD